MTILRYDGNQYVVLTWLVVENVPTVMCADVETGAVRRFSWLELSSLKVTEHDGYKVGAPLPFDKR